MIPLFLSPTDTHPAGLVELVFDQESKTIAGNYNVQSDDPLQLFMIATFISDAGRYYNLSTATPEAPDSPLDEI